MLRWFLPMDRNVGKVLGKLKELNLLNNTLIIFSSDNGGLTTEENKKRTPPTSVKPLRAGKGWLNEGGIRVPLIIKPPNKSQRSVSDAFAISMDLCPTILDYLNIPFNWSQHKDGKSLRLVIENHKSQVHELLFWHYPHYHSSGWIPGSAVREGPWKLIHYYENDVYELYNLEKDLSEENNIIDKKRRIFRKLKKKLEQKITETISKLPESNLE